MRLSNISCPLFVVGGKARGEKRRGPFIGESKPFDDELLLSAVRKAVAEQAEGQVAQAERQAILDRIATLSNREHEVMEALVAGAANKVIAYDLGISARTVEVYRANVMLKMQAKTLSDLVRLAMTARA